MLMILNLEIFNVIIHFDSAYLNLLPSITPKYFYQT